MNIKPFTMALDSQEIANILTDWEIFGTVSTLSRSVTRPPHS